MTRIAATVRDGLIVPREPLDWPDGTEVEVSTVADRIDDDERPETPEEIEAWIAAWNAIPTPVMSEDEWAACERRRQEDREWELAHAEGREAKIRRNLE